MSEAEELRQLLDDRGIPCCETTPYCPFAPDGRCRPTCMMLLTYAPEGATEGPTDHGEGVCAIAAAASHIVSETHFGGNLLMKVVAFDYRGKVAR